MTEIVLRKARSTDAGSVGSILSDFIDETPWMPRIHTRAEDLSFAGDMIERGWVTVAEIGTRVAGFLSLNENILHSLYVNGADRGQGVGQALLCNTQANTTDLVLWTFQANVRAQKFYKRHGFAEVERGDGSSNDEGLPDIKFVWNAGPA